MHTPSLESSAPWVMVTPVLAFLFSLFVSTAPACAQEYDLVYKLPQGQTVKYKRIVEENAYAELNSNISVKIVKKKESYFSITGAGKDGEALLLTFLQDTVYVQETPPPPNPGESGKIDNLLTQIPVRLTVTEKGELIAAQAGKPILETKGFADRNLSERQLAMEAMFLPKLPEEAVTPGQIWEASARDTVIPYPNLGKRNSLRISTVDVTYRAEGTETISGLKCMKVTWESRSLVEEKYIEGAQERFSEEKTTTKGAYYIAVDSAVLVQLDQQADTEMTTVFFGEKNGQVPYTNSIHTTVRLQK